MLQDIEAVIFDVDGTLLNSNGVWQKIDKDFMEERNLEFSEFFQKEIDGMTFHQVAEFCRNKFDLKETPEELMDIWKSMAINEYSYNVDAKKGAKEFIKHLKDKGVKLAVCSSNSHDLIDPALKRNEIFDDIDIFYTATIIGDAKDDPKVYLKIADELEVEPKKCLVFDDIVPIMEATNKAGMRNCIVLDDRSLEIYGKDLLIESADYYIYDYRDIDYERNNN